jgi:hypothetical protein
MNNEIIKNRLSKYENLKYYFGESKNKIDAINRDLDKLPDGYEILINMSDDQIFTMKGYDLLIKAAFNQLFPNKEGFLHFHDGNQPRLATMTIINRKHFERFNYIYHPDYKSVYCDNEQQLIAQMLGCYKYLGDKLKIMSHIHPAFGHKNTLDKQYVHTESFYKEDSQTFERRKSINFGLENN